MASYQLTDPTKGLELDLKKDKVESKSSGLLGGLLGMGASIGGMIPSLLKGPQQKELQRIQRGGGAGAAIARQTASEAARRVAGNMGGRGGQGMVREGLRAADAIVQRGAQQAAVTGAREGLAATQMLRGNDLRRRDAFKTLGAGLGQGLAGIGGMLAAARDQGDQKEAQLQTAETVAAQGGPATATMQSGAAAAPALPGGAAGPVPTETEQTVGEFGAAQTRLQDTAQGPYKEAIDQKSDAMQERGRMTAQGLVEANSPQAQIDRNLSGLVTATEEKRQAADIYSATAATAIGPPPPGGSSPPGMMHPPEHVEDYLYNMAMNYDPRINQGMRPDLVAELLLERGLVVDWERLGTVEPQPEQASYKSPHARLGEKATSGARAAGEKIRGAFGGR